MVSFHIGRLIKTQIGIRLKDWQLERSQKSPEDKSILKKIEIDNKQIKESNKLILSKLEQMQKNSTLEEVEKLLKRK